MVRYDAKRSFNAMLGLPSKPHDPTTRALGLVARWERAMNRPAYELDDQELGTLFGQNPSEAERPLLVAAAIDRIALAPLASYGQCFVTVVLQGHRAILDANPDLRLRLANVLRIHRRAFVGTEEERDVCAFLESVETENRPHADYDRARPLRELLGYETWEEAPGNPYDRAMNAPAGELDADALEGVYAHYPNAGELRLLAHAAVDLLERDAFAAAGRPLLSHLLHDSRFALDRDPALAARLRLVLAETAPLYECDQDELIVQAFLTASFTR